MTETPKQEDKKPRDRTEYFKRYREENPHRCKEWREKNRAKQRSWDSEYRKSNKEKIQANQAAYRKRHENDPEFRLKKNLRERVRVALKGLTKGASIMNLTGCTVQELKTHIEKQFQVGMSWDNYGTWHVDHIKPCALFNLSTFKAQLECFHYTNLQPLWALENISKGMKYPCK